MKSWKRKNQMLDFGGLSFVYVFQGKKKSPLLWLEVFFSLAAGKWSVLAQKHNSLCLWPEMPSESTHHNLFVVHMWMHNKNKCFFSFVVTFPVDTVKVSWQIEKQNNKTCCYILLSLLNIKQCFTLNYYVVVVTYFLALPQRVCQQSWSCVTLQLFCSNRERKKIIKSLRVCAM